MNIAHTNIFYMERTRETDTNMTSNIRILFDELKFKLVICLHVLYKGEINRESSIS